MEIIIITVSLFSKASSPKENSTISPTPITTSTGSQTTPPNNLDAPTNDIFYRTPKEKQQDNQMSFVTDLISKLPYYGTLFTLEYNFNTATFILSLDATKLNEANNEFDVYLKNNGIADRSLFDNLVTTYK